MAMHRIFFRNIYILHGHTSCTLKSCLMSTKGFVILTAAYRGRKPKKTSSIVHHMLIDILWKINRVEECTRVSITQFVASLQTRQQVAFTPFVPSCQQFWNKLLTAVNNLVNIIRLGARLSQQVRYIVTTLHRQTCNILVSWPHQTC